LIRAEKMKIKIIQIGNSKGIVIPKHLLAKTGLNNHFEVEMNIVNGAIVLRNPFQSVRVGWREAAQEVNASGTDVFLLEGLANLQDEDLVW
jgi:antitoxin MazE